MYRKEGLERHFNKYNNTTIKYRIDPTNIYDIDETGFCIRLID